MNLDTVDATTFGRGLSGVGVNLLTPDVRALAHMMVEVFGRTAHQVSDDFAIIRHMDTFIQIHADGTFGRHPLLGYVPESPPRGGGVQIYLFGVDPDVAVARAATTGHMVIEHPTNKPHGLR